MTSVKWEDAWNYSPVGCVKFEEKGEDEKEKDDEEKDDEDEEEEEEEEEEETRAALPTKKIRERSSMGKRGAA
uniref:Uncharacterized protein n=1 Tax=Vespula pensylvanica TaxID=30213 RepID=A0A834P359_VESPE|nr:hypothetical protein H0235_006682 [Vespula pensylvanica]